ncbi:MAG: cyclic nucleotide-binding domain-containing protein [Chloroflexi bacterium]|nr:cyclic nucleotide-binding domain-containing protein [Chloroflexota bacterium]
MMRSGVLQDADWLAFGGIIVGSAVGAASLMAILGGYILVLTLLTMIGFGVVGYGIALGIRRAMAGAAVWSGKQAKAVAPTSADRALPRERAAPVAGADQVRVCGCPASTLAVTVDDLLHVDIFQNLAPAQLALVAALGRSEDRGHGDVLGDQGSRGVALYLILAGQVELLTVTPMGELTVRVAGVGESLPLAALIGDGTLITKAVALSEVRLAVIPRAALLDLCAAHPDIGMHLFRAVAEILAVRYQSTLHRLGQSMDQALRQPELWANV